MPTITERLRAAYQGFKTGMNPFSSGVNESRQYESDDERLLKYAERWAWYQGYLSRENNRVVTRSQRKRLKFNFVRPICGMAAGWAAGPKVTWLVSGESNDQTKALSGMAQAIWDRSEGDAEFLQASLTGSIYGDLVLSVKRGIDGRIMLEWCNPFQCVPFFDPGDVSRLMAMRICYGEGESRYEEVWEPGRLTVTKGDEKQGSVEETQLLTNEVPFAWIPNMAIKGQAFGDAEPDAVMPLIQEYDHVASKETRIIDRYSSPTIHASGVRKEDAALEKGIETVFYTPDPNSKVQYLEWHGNRPDVKEQLDRIRTAISEVSETPSIAFGQIDSGFSGASGVSLKVLYGPANGKRDRKRSLWGPRIERMMHLALTEEGITLDPEQVSIVWSDATPQSELEFLQVLEAKHRLGATAERVLVEAGYSPKDAAQMVEEGKQEDERKAEQQARAFSRGSVID